MATVIDELVVRLGLDSSSFKEGQKGVEGDLNRTRKASDKTARDVQANGKRAAEFFGQMERAALKFFAVFTLGRGFAEFTRTVVTGGANIARLSRNLGVSADMLSRWGDAVAKNGGTAEGFQSTLQTLSGALTDIKIKGDSSLIPFFQALGVSIDDGTGNAKELGALLLDVGDGLKRRFGNRADAVNFAKQYGLDEGTINLLMQGRGEIQRTLAAQKGLTDQQAASAERAERKLKDMQTRIEAVTRELVYKMLPTIEKLTELMARFAEVSIPILGDIIDFFIRLDKATDGWSTTLLVALGTLRLIAGVSLANLAAGIASVGGATSGAMAALGKLGGALGLLTYSKELGDGSLPGFVERYQQAQAAKGAPSAPAAPGTSGAAPRAGGRQTRGMRNNNPGNLEFAGQRGAVRENGEGRFAKFGTLSEGVAALGRQLQLYGKRGINTLRKVIETWAPRYNKKTGKIENDTEGYISRMREMTGFGENQRINLQDASTLGLLIRGITTVENGRNFVGREDMLSGLQQLRERPATGTQPISIGQITIVTQSTEARGIARDIRQALVRQADSGMR